MASRFLVALALVWLVLALAGGAFHAKLRAADDTGFVPAAPEGLLETGAPSAVVLSSESLGMSSFPTDVRELPDGRILVVSPTEISIGDGVRWDLYRKSLDENEATSGRVAVDKDGSLYTAVRGGVARIVLETGGQWSLERQFSLLDREKAGGILMRSTLEVGQDWYWYASGGTLVKWRPGRSFELVAQSAVTDLVFAVGSKLFVANLGLNGLFGLEGGQLVPVPNLLDRQVNATVTAALALDDETTLVAVHPGGLRVFDGKTMRSFVDGASFANNNRVTSVCKVGEDQYAVSVDGTGVFFFDQGGRAIQLLDYRTDPRFARVSHMVSSQKGVLWLLLNDGIARVQFPSGLSRFEERVGAGLYYSAPVRWKEQLWLQADGQVMRGVYDANGRLNRFEDHSPSGFLFLLSNVDGHLFASTDQGLYERVGEGWNLVLPDMINGRVELAPDTVGRFWYVARGEVGWLKRRVGGGWDRQQFAAPELGDPYSVAREGQVLWMELGGSQVGRVDLSRSPVEVEIYRKEAGLPDGWMQIFRGRKNLQFLSGGQLYRFDEQARRFFLDTETMAKEPWWRGAMGRPGFDAKGNLWITTNLGCRVLAPDPDEGMKEARVFPSGILPFSFVMEEGGVVWLRQKGRLLRYDPAFPDGEQVETAAMITRVEFPGKRLPVSKPTGDFGDLAYEDNSPTFYFMAPGNPFSAAATFEVRLEGGENRWISLGVSGTATFHRLYEGQYTLHVRPVVAGQPREATSLAFRVLPPWYRHPVAYLGYGGAAVLLLFGAGQASSYLQRREKARLERLVEARTRDVQQANRELESQVAETVQKSIELRESEERYRALYDFNPAMYFTLDHHGRVLSVNRYGADQLGYDPSELVGRMVLDFTHPEEHRQLKAVQGQCLAHPERSHTWQSRKVRRDGEVIHVKEIARAVQKPDGSLVMFIVCEDISANVKLEDQLRQAQKMEAVGQLAGGVAHDFNNLLTIIQGQAEWVETFATTEAERTEGIQQIRMAADQATKLTRQLLVFSRRQAMQVEPADLNLVISKVVKLIERVIGEDIRVETRFAQAASPARIDSGMMEQVLVNLAVNARDAMPKGGRVMIDVTPCLAGADQVLGKVGVRAGRYFCISFSDTGEGIAPSVLPRIFEPFYTTKAPGSGDGPRLGDFGEYPQPASRVDRSGEFAGEGHDVSALFA